jgi:hypothetical protein
MRGALGVDLPLDGSTGRMQQSLNRQSGVHRRSLAANPYPAINSEARFTALTILM